MKKKPRAYLAGAMEKASSFGRLWREEITPHLESRGYEVWNPYKEEAAVGITVEEMAKLKVRDVDEFWRLSRKIVEYDTSAVIGSNLLVCLIDDAVLAGAGTFGELTVAREHGIPVIAWIDLPRGLRDLPGWAFGCIDLYSLNKKEFYESIPDLSGQRQK